MFTIIFKNEKGGVGKTTLAEHFAAGNAIRGKRVLLIDTDPQASLTIALGGEPFDGVFRLLAQYAEWNTVTFNVPFENYAGDYPLEGAGKLDIVPGHLNSRAIPSVVSEADLLAERLDELRGLYDLVVMDTGPTPSMLDTLLYRSADFVVIPTECDFLSLAGLNNTVKHIANEQRIRPAAGLPPLHFAGIQPTKYQSRTVAHQRGMEDLQAHFPHQLMAPITHRTLWREATTEALTLYAFAPGEAAEDEAWHFVDQLSARITHLQEA
jgi:chromosome partitioning protein